MVLSQGHGQVLLALFLGAFMKLFFDVETYLITRDVAFPKMVCVSWAYRDDAGDIVTGLLGNGDDLTPFWDLLFDADLMCAHKASFDLGVIYTHYPHLQPLIWQALEDGKVTDTLLREKLINLSTHGHLDEVELPNGAKRPIRYHLADLVRDRLGEDISSKKEGDDIWRLNFSVLDGAKAADYPDEARDYAIQDSVYALKVFEAQQIDAEERGASMAPEQFRAAVDFALALQSSEGFEVDQGELKKLSDMLAKELSPERMEPLYAVGIVRRPEPPRPHARGAKGPDGQPKMTKGKPESVDMATLRSIISKVCADHEIPVVQTEAGAISTAEEFLADLAPLDPHLKLYHERGKLQKLVSTEIPRLSFQRVYPGYDSLKETGRTSSYNDKLRGTLNIQNIDPRVRPCFKARDGWLLCSVDYAALELATAAQQLVDLFGHSTLADLINAGKDPHAYLGCVLAAKLDAAFSLTAQGAGIFDIEGLYKFFTSLKTSPDPKLVKLYEHYRTFAKPTGLGYPGGLGAETFVAYAKATYGVDLVAITGSKDAAIALARDLKEIWLEVFPEWRRYFEWINTSCQDPRNLDKYAYQTAMGMVRRGASYCATSNGAALQSRAAEGAVFGVFNVARECYDATLDSILLGCRPLAFIHDQQIVEIPDDNLAHERAERISSLMIDSMQALTPDIKIRVEACLMRNWHKKAKPVYTPDKRLAVWTPPT